MDYLFNPDDHFDENGTNVLQALKEEYGTDLYLLIDNFYFSNEGWQVFKELTEEDYEEYYQMDYLNRICSSKYLNGENKPLYWVI